MEDLVAGWPFWAVFVVLWVGAVARGTATYWVGRGVRAGGARSRWAHHLDRPVVARAELWVRRIGPPAVTLGFLPVGVQTAINASAGMLRMPLRHFVPSPPQLAPRVPVPVSGEVGGRQTLMPMLET